MIDVDKRWGELSKRYKNYIKLEKRLADNSVESYMRDLRRFSLFVIGRHNVTPKWTTAAMIEEFMASLFDVGVEKATQARILSGVKSFFNFLLLEGVVDTSPAEFVEGPKIGRKLPEVLTQDEIDRIIAVFDDSSMPFGLRNAAMFEALYSCGLRVTELVELRLGDLFFNDGFIRVTGKGDKQRLVPISNIAREKISKYLSVRNAKEGTEDVLFLNNRGKRLSRQMVFMLLRKAAQMAGVDKTIGPHTLRHSFATHLMEGGANIRQVQEMLGHESILTTEIYTHLDTSHLRLTIDKHHPLSK